MRQLRYSYLLFLLATTVAAEAPWSTTADSPTFAGPAPAKIPLLDGTAGATCRFWLRFYQTWIGTVTRSPCRMEPSCSNYALQAIQKHGASIGIVMAADRLLHEADEQKAMRVVRAPGRAFCPDPVCNNDFWWYKR